MLSEVPRRASEEPAEVELPAPDIVPAPPSFRRIARRLVVAGLRQLGALADKLDDE